MNRPNVLWGGFLILWAGSQIVFGAVSPRPAAMTAGAMALLYAASLFLLPGHTGISRWGRLFLVTILAVFCVHLLPLGAIIAPYTNALRATHGTGSLWPSTADTFLTLRAFAKVSTYILAALLVLRLRQAGLPALSMLKGVCLVMAAQAIYAVGQVPFDWPIPFYGSRLSPAASGTLVNQNSFAGLMGMGLVAAVGLAFAHMHYERQEQAKGWIWNRRLETGVIWGLAAALFVLAIVMSQSRGGAIAAMAAVIAFPLFFRGRSSSLGLFAILTLCTIGVLVAHPGTLLGRLQDIDPSKLSSEQRWEYWKTSTRAAMHQPALGFGLGTHPAAYHPFQPAAQAKQLNHPHNEYVNACFEGGFVWLGILLAGISVWLIRVWKSLRRLSGPDRIPLATALAALFGVIIHAVVDFDLQITSVGMLAAVMVAIGASRFRYGITPSPVIGGIAPCLAGIIGAVAIGLPWLNPEHRMQEARKADPEAAETMFIKTLGLSPYHYKTVWMRGVAAEQRGDRQTADRHFVTATDLWPSHTGLQEEGGIWFWGRYRETEEPEHLSRAQACIRRLLLQKPHIAGSVLQRIWSPEVNPETYTTLLPNEPRAWAEAAGFLVQQGLWREGMDLFGRGCPPDPSRAEAFDAFADRLENAGQWGMELEIRERRLAVRSDAVAYAAAAHAWSRLAAHEKAVDRITTAIRIDPANPAWRDRLSMILTEKGDITGAIEACSTTLQMDPSRNGARFRRGNLLVHEKMYTAAASDFNELLRSQPDDRAYMISLVRVLQWNGDSEAALAVLDPYLSRHPDDLELRKVREELAHKAAPRQRR